MYDTHAKAVAVSEQRFKSYWNPKSKNLPPTPPSPPPAPITRPAVADEMDAMIAHIKFLMAELEKLAPAPPEKDQ